MTEKKWTGTTGGNGLMHRWLIALLRYANLRCIYAITYIFVVPPTIFRKGFRHIYRYFRQRMGHGRWRSFWLTYKNHCLFAQVVIDKFAMYAGRKFDIDLVGYDNFLRLAALPDGFVQLSSHVGNYEIAGYSLVAEKKRFNALVYFGEEEEVMNNREKLFAHSHIHMIPIKADMSHLFEINNALSNGETVSIPADRIFGSQKFVAVPFLGEEAHFPIGPFQIASARGVDVLTVHCMKTGIKRYKIIVTPLAYDKTKPRKEQIQQLATAYVEELQRIVREYPVQWYNYFDFWKQ